MTRIVEPDRIGAIVAARPDVDWAAVRGGEGAYRAKWQKAMQAFGFTDDELYVIVDATDFFCRCRDDGLDLERELPRFHRIVDNVKAILEHLGMSFEDALRRLLPPATRHAWFSDHDADSLGYALFYPKDRIYDSNGFTREFKENVVRRALNAVCGAAGFAIRREDDILIYDGRED